MSLPLYLNIWENKYHEADGLTNCSKEKDTFPLYCRAIYVLDITRKLFAIHIVNGFFYDISLEISLLIYISNMSNWMYLFMNVYTEGVLAVFLYFNIYVYMIQSPFYSEINWNFTFLKFQGYNEEVKAP